MGTTFLIIGCILAGMLFGFAVMGIFSARSYERGRRDERNQLPMDISNYLNDQL